MAKRIKILGVHGLGDHRNSTWKADWQSAIGAAFPGQGEITLEFEFITYDPIFEKEQISPWDTAKALWKLTSSAVTSSFRRDKGVVSKISDRVRWTAGYVVAWVEEDSFKEKTRALVLDALRDYRPDILCAHSLGSLVTYNAITHRKADADAAVRDALAQMRLVTLGSQIANPFVVRNLTTGRVRVPPVKHWYHLFNAHDDVFTAPIRIHDADNFRQVETPFDKEGFGDHSAEAYLSHNATIGNVWRPIAEETLAPPRARLFGSSAVSRAAPRPARDRKKRYKALLVGINDYPNKADRLEGCVNDAYRMSEVLQECGFPAESIRLCLNERATARGILDRLEWLLDDPRPEDEIVFYYSGHGAQIPEYGEDNEPDRSTETLVPHDFDWTPEHAITDDRIYCLYSQLPFDTRFAMIFDCCHSGGVHRAGVNRPRGINPPDDIRHREIEWDQKRGMWVPRGFKKLNPDFSRREDVNRQFFGTNEATVRLGRASAVRGMSEAEYNKRKREAGNTRIGPFLPLILQACAEGELSYEYQHGSTSFGAFTFSLTKTLRTAKSISFRTLLDRTGRELRDLEYQQTPQILGPEAIVRGESAVDRGIADAVLDERARVAARRSELGRCPVREHGRGELRGLALSGGGIRSATFSLGVMQALAANRPAAPTTIDAATERSWLAEFDYLSTVSGGGYAGGFFVSLFVPRRLRAPSRADATPEQNAAFDAYEVMRQNPPGRIRSSDDYSTAPARLKAPLAWLRESGRYLTPTNSGDYVYLAGIAVRNWVAVHYVIATVLVTLLTLIAAARSAAFAEYPALETFWFPSAADVLWLSPLFVLVLPVVFLWLVPSGIGFFLTHPDAGSDSAEKPRLFCRAALVAFVIGIAGLGVSAVAWRHPAEVPQGLAGAFGAASFVTLLALGYHVATCGSPSIAAQRVVLTRVLASGLKALAVVLLLALIDTIGQTLYLFSIGDSRWAALGTAPGIALVVSLFRYIARRSDAALESRTSADAEGTHKWVSALPLGVLAGIGAGLLFVLVAGVESLLVQWLVWRGEPPILRNPTNAIVLVGWFAAFLLLAWITGRFSGFLNLSTLMSFYGARLTRAYFGASNGRRFDKEGEQARSVAEPIEDDMIARADYYKSPLAPVHVVNVTVNQTIDPAEQLVQRDRKGRPLAVLPDGFTIDRSLYTFNETEASLASGSNTEKLSMGHWIAASGAALTTGLGRATTLGSSLALGLANVRLGHWWGSGYGDDQSSGLTRWFKSAFKTQVFLFYELMGRFHGLHREWQYLSDGGHFENTGLYELLRPERRLRLIVACDCGSDPKYRFNDVANLIRLVRIDFGARVEVDAEIARMPNLERVFGVPGNFAYADRDSDKCAMLLNVFHTGNEGTMPDCRVIVVKPRVVASATADVHEYKSTRGDFPQQATTDQFFDEAQWESYRSLGYTIGELVFGSGIAADLERVLERASTR